MKFDRDTVLSDIKNNVCEVFLKRNDGAKVAIRCSLFHEVLPQSYFVTEESKINEFHLVNPTMIAAWNLTDQKWFQFSVDAIQYIQIVDTY